MVKPLFICYEDIRATPLWTGMGHYGYEDIRATPFRFDDNEKRRMKNARGVAPQSS